MGERAARHGVGLLHDHKGVHDEGAGGERVVGRRAARQQAAQRGEQGVSARPRAR